MFAVKALRLLSDKDWKVLQRLSQVRQCTLMTTKKNDLYSIYKILNPNRYLTNVCTLYHLKTFCTASENVKLFETEYARNILEKSDHEFNSLVYSLPVKQDLLTDEIENVINKKWISMSNLDILENFEFLSYYASKQNICVTDPKYEGIFEVLKNRLSTFSDEELNSLLSYLNLWNNKKRLSDYKGFWQELDEECLRRSSSWNLEKILLMNDHFYKLRLLKKSKFISNTLQTLDPAKMSPANLLQYLFLLRVNNRMPINFKKLEYYVEKHAAKFTLDELGIIGMAFFKYENRIQSKKFIVFIINQLIMNIDNVEDISLSALLKILRYSIFLEIGEHFILLLDALVTQVHKRRLITLTHFAHLQAAALYDNKTLISNLRDRFENEIKSARSKDIERILFTMYILNYDDPKSTSFYSLSLDELLSPARKAELDRFPRELVYSVMYLLHLNIYPTEILKMIMHPDYIKKITDGNSSTLNREYVFIDYSLQIECPEYNGPRLEKQIRNALVMKYGSSSEQTKEHQNAKFIRDVASVCENLTNSKLAVCVHPLLPHFVHNNIILCYDEDKKQFLNCREYFRSFMHTDIKYSPNDGKKWYALVLGSHNLIIRNTFKPTGLLSAHLRQLKKIGYIPILINYTEWRHLNVDDRRKKKYIEFLLKQ